jgi:hypothetical protein
VIGLQSQKYKMVMHITLQIACINKKKPADTKMVIRIRISKKNKQHSGQKEKGQTTIYKTEDRVTQTPIKTTSSLQKKTSRLLFPLSPIKKSEIADESLESVFCIYIKQKINIHLFIHLLYTIFACTYFCFFFYYDIQSNLPMWSSLLSSHLY